MEVRDGDLYIVINVRPHKMFERRGQDLWLEIPITFDQAALGDDIVVPTLEEKVSYKVPAGTQPGTVFRLKGKGIKSVRSSKKGDLYVKVTLEIPTKLNAKQKKAIATMAKSVTSDCYHKKSSSWIPSKNFLLRRSKVYNIECRPVYSLHSICGYVTAGLCSRI